MASAPVILNYPSVIGVVASVEALIVACHEPQEVCLVAGGGNCGVIAVGELNELVVLNSVSFVDLAVSSVETLNCEALLRIE